MIEPTEGRPRPGRLLLYVAIAAVSSMVAMLPGLDVGDKSPETAAGIHADDPPESKSTLAPTTTLPVPVPPVQQPASTPVPRLNVSTGGFGAAPAAPALAPAALLPVTAATPFAFPVAPPTTPPTTLPVVPPTIGGVAAPNTGIYLGAYPDPFTSNGESTIQEVLTHLPEFNDQVGRKLAIVSIYQPWSDGWVLNENLTQIADAQGAIPMVSWRCGETDEQVASGASDPLIFRFANQLKAYGRPVLLRWFWEVNFLTNDRCLGTGTPEEVAANYIAAFQRISGIFAAAGATNVSLVWAPSTATVAADMEDFYPGDAYVDWIGADGYDRQQLGADAFATQFTDWYAAFEGRGKPMIITETGATTDQKEFLHGIADVVPRQFPQIKAVIYFDAVGDTDWRLGSYDASGITAFAELGRSPNFTVMPKS